MTKYDPSTTHADTIKTKRRTSLIAAIVFGALTLGLFWPIVRQSGGVLYDRSDSVLNVWILNWQAHILTRHPLDLFAAPIFYPLRSSLAFSEIIWPAAPLALPLQAVTGNPVMVYNVLYLGNFVLAGMGAFLLARAVVASPLAALLAGLIYAFSSHQFGHLSQIQLLSIGWLPLALLALDRLWRFQRPRDGALLACCIVFQSLSAFYYAFQVALLSGMYILFLLAIVSLDRRSGYGLPRPQSRLAKTSWRLSANDVPARVLHLALWGMVAAAVILPFTLPYFHVRSEFGLQRSLEEALAFSPPLIDYLVPRADNPLYTPLFAIVPPIQATAVGGLFLGITATVLALVGFLTWGPGQRSAHGRQARSPLTVRWFWLVMFIVAVLLSLGPQLKITPGDPGGPGLPFQWLFEHVPGFTAIRAPGRFAVSAFLALAILAASGAAWLLARAPGQRLRMLLTGLLGALIVAEYAAGFVPVTGRPMPDLDPPPGVVAWLAEQPPTVIVELPLTSEMASPPDLMPPVDSPDAQGDSHPDGAPDLMRAWPDFNMFRYQYAATAHWQPSVDGFTGFVPPHHRELGLSMAQFPSERSVAILRGLGVEYVILHSQLMEDFQPGRAASLRQALEVTDGVQHVQDFGPAWVYHILPAEPALIEGKFWTTENGDAFLLLTTTDTHVFSPTQQIPIRATWQPASGGRATEQIHLADMPLAVSGASVTPLGLTKPEAAGSYTLTLQADSLALSVPLRQQRVTVDPAAAPVVLMPVQLSSVAAPAESAGGATIDVELRWLLLDRPVADVSVGLHVLTESGDKVVNNDQALSGGRDLVGQWKPGMILTTTHSLALPRIDEDRLTLRVFFYRPDHPADYLFFDAEGVPTSEILLPLRLSDGDGD
jgi:hypothetical protein